MTSRHLIDLNSLHRFECDQIVALAKDIQKNPFKYSEACKGKILATLFYEPSTRTLMSFQTAMFRLGGQVIGFDNPNNSSVAKGESLKDTVTVVSGYADAIVIRHSVAGTAKAASLYSRVPVINAGDGGHLHPTQTLTDLVTLSSEKGRLSNLVIGCCGDLKNGRTVHSLVKEMARFEGNSFIFISTPELTIPQYIKEILDSNAVSYTECSSLEEAMPLLDVLYMTRIQRERFCNADEYERQKGVFILDMPKLARAKPDLKILHPMPRVDEIDIAVDDDDRAVYFKQTEYGMYARMALILTILHDGERRNHPMLASTKTVLCQNASCITHIEQYLPRIFAQTKRGDELVCEYCEERTPK